MEIRPPKTTRPPAAPETPIFDKERYARYIDQGFCGELVYNVTVLLTKTLAHSIYNSEINWRTELGDLIKQWNADGITVPWLNEWEQVSLMAEGLQPIDSLTHKNMFLDAFGVAFYNFFRPEEIAKLPNGLLILINEEYSKNGDKVVLHEVAGVRHFLSQIQRFLQNLPASMNNFFWAVIELTIRKAEWGVSRLRKDTHQMLSRVRTQPVANDMVDLVEDLVKVQKMITIRNVIVHESKRLATFGENEDKLEDVKSIYESFIRRVRHVDIYPSRARAAEIERLLKPVKDFKEFKILPEEVASLRKENNQLQRRIRSAEQRITELEEENDWLFDREAKLMAEVEDLQRRLNAENSQ